MRSRPYLPSKQQIIRAFRNHFHGIHFAENITVVRAYMDEIIFNILGIDEI